MVKTLCTATVFNSDKQEQTKFAIKRFVNKAGIEQYRVTANGVLLAATDSLRDAFKVYNRAVDAATDSVKINRK